MSKVAIREGLAGDVPAVLDLWSLARSGHASLVDTADDVRRLLDDRPGALLVAEIDGLIVGAVVATSDGWRGNMYRLAVHPDHRRNGIALGLVQAGEQRVRAAGIVRITALVAHDDPDACGLWAAADYEADREISRFVRNL